MVSVVQVPTTAILRRIHQIQAITIVWMVVEACLSLSAAWIARSPALLAFGADSAIELLSAGGGVWRFREQSRPEQLERQAARIAGALLFAVAACVVVSVVSLLGYHEPRPTYLTNSSGGCSRDHAVARPTETPVVCDDEQRRAQGRCGRIRAVRLSLLDRSGGGWIERDLAYP